MATATGKNQCAICQKEKRTVLCDGCLKTFCYSHLNDHRQELSKEFDEVQVIRDIFRQTLAEQISDPRKHHLIVEINQWEQESIKKIQNAAEDARQQLLQHVTSHATNIEKRLTKLTEQLRQSREENDFVETDINQWKEQLQQLNEELTKPSTVTLQQDTIPLVYKLSIYTANPVILPNISVNATWEQNGITVAGGNGVGNGLNQLSSPEDVYVYDDKTIYVADYGNHRIVEWILGANTGKVVAGGNGAGVRTDQLNGPTHVIVDKNKDCLIICDQGNQRIVRWPRQNGTVGQIIVSNIYGWGVALDSEGNLYFADYYKHEVRCWQEKTMSEMVIAGGNGAGGRLDQFITPSYIFVDHNNTLYVSDYGNNRVMKWMKGAKEGIVVAGGQDSGNNLTQLSNPYGFVVDQVETVYVADRGNNRVIRWPVGAKQGSIVAGGNGQGSENSQFNGLINLAMDQHGHLFVADMYNHRIQKFNINSVSDSK